MCVFVKTPVYVFYWGSTFSLHPFGFRLDSPAFKSRVGCLARSHAGRLFVWQTSRTNKTTVGTAPVDRHSSQTLDHPITSKSNKNSMNVTMSWCMQLGDELQTE